MTKVDRLDHMDDYLELQDPALKQQEEQGHGRARKASRFLAELRRSAARSKR